MTKIFRASGAAIKTNEKLENVFKGLSSTDTSVAVFGSFARKNWTSKSDFDWMLLVDGQADAQHL